MFTTAAGTATRLCPDHGSGLFFASAKASHPCLKAGERKGLVSLNHTGMAAVVWQGMGSGCLREWSCVCEAA